MMLSTRDCIKQLTLALFHWQKLPGCSCREYWRIVITDTFCTNIGVDGNYIQPAKSEDSYWQKLESVFFIKVTVNKISTLILIPLTPYRAKNPLAMAILTVKYGLSYTRSEGPISHWILGTRGDGGRSIYRWSALTPLLRLPAWLGGVVWLALSPAAISLW